jgi:dTMP kinase
MKDRQYPGYLISFEGGEGSGKSGGVFYAVERLRAQGLKVVAMREPGGDVIGEEIREVVLKQRFGRVNVHPLTEAYFYQASRSQMTVSQIIPRLEMGEIVLMDRFGDSSIVYQGYVRGVGCGRVNRLNEMSTRGLTPDLTLLFDVEAETGLERRNTTGEINRLDAEGLQFHQKVNEVYRQLAEFDMSFEQESRWEIVDANLSQDEVLAGMMNILEGRLMTAGFIEGGRRSIERNG